MRDFLASRVVNGRQQIRAAITFHENGRLVMWPYGYTLTDVPSDMTAQDHAALVAHRQADGLDERLYARAGERPVRQLGHDARLPIRRRTGCSRYTFEMSPKDIPTRTTRSSHRRPGATRKPCCTLMERAWCPLSACSGRAVRTARCGAFDDDLEVGRGWTRQPGRDRHGAGHRSGSCEATRPRPRATARSSAGRRRRGRSRS